jgi:D-alanyl-D-alanine dipeptidase
MNNLLENALEVEPPKEDRATLRTSELVDLETVSDTFVLDIRYASTNNFMGFPLYRQAKAFLQRPAADALARVEKRLEGHGFGLIVYDGYRPWHVTWLFWEQSEDDQKLFLANPAEGSKHNRGCAVDVGLFLLSTKQPVDFPSDFDEMTSRSFSDYEGGTEQQNLHRALLREAMEAEGFAVHPHEWWHFDYKEWQLYPIENFSFESLT